MNDKELRAYAKMLVTGKIPTMVSAKFSEENDGQELTLQFAEEQLRAKFKEIAPNRKALRRNKIQVFELMEESIDEIFPKRANEIFDKFCEFKTFVNGNKPIFKMPKGKGQVRRFITRIALGTPLKRVRLDGKIIDVTMFALGGACYIEYEQYLAGDFDFVDLCDTLVDELINATYDEISAQLKSAVDNAKFKKIETEGTDAFSMTSLQACIDYAKSFGAGGATVLGVSAMTSRIKDADFSSDEDKTDMRERGYIGKVRGASVVSIPQSYDKDGMPLFPDDVLFVFPSGDRPEDKFLKIAYEGDTEIKDKESNDRSMTYEVYAKMGIAIGQTTGIGVYKKYSA